MARYNIEEYSILVHQDSDFCVREREVSHTLCKLVVKSGCDAGMVLRVVKVHHVVQFCKAMAFDNGYRIFVCVERAVHRDYKKGDSYSIVTMGKGLEEYVTEKYNKS